MEYGRRDKVNIGSTVLKLDNHSLRAAQNWHKSPPSLLLPPKVVSYFNERPYQQLRPRSNTMSTIISKLKTSSTRKDANKPRVPYFSWRYPNNYQQAMSARSHDMNSATIFADVLAYH